ncbi:uncharacterized protein BJ171DRAFT_596701 [Polychytrium aggregatum]|uniref:uncharacterized protein n=1 Tax=Polychytrium aggregatum TaxID=110093 RepID=UPI0022FF1987|nr:uncharacterized protein BJ171DRAFT_596701 [Polychytrium aggregatum]KAI9207710.1 hypothetical protein BJ171DRAFT_596701 [Polychytrium aggregatum]
MKGIAGFEPQDLHPPAPGTLPIEERETNPRSDQVQTIPTTGIQPVFLGVIGEASTEEWQPPSPRPRSVGHALPTTVLQLQDILQINNEPRGHPALLDKAAVDPAELDPWHLHPWKRPYQPQSDGGLDDIKSPVRRALREWQSVSPSEVRTALRAGLIHSVEEYVVKKNDEAIEARARQAQPKNWRSSNQGDSKQQKPPKQQKSPKQQKQKQRKRKPERQKSLSPGVNAVSFLANAQAHPASDPTDPLPASAAQSPNVSSHSVDGTSTGQTNASLDPSASPSHPPGTKPTKIEPAPYPHLLGSRSASPTGAPRHETQKWLSENLASGGPRSLSDFHKPVDDRPFQQKQLNYTPVFRYEPSLHPPLEVTSRRVIIWPGQMKEGFHSLDLSPEASLPIVIDAPKALKFKDHDMLSSPLEVHESKAISIMYRAPAPPKVEPRGDRYNSISLPALLPVADQRQSSPRSEAEAHKLPLKLPMLPHSIEAQKLSLHGSEVSKRRVEKADGKQQSEKLYEAMHKQYPAVVVDAVADPDADLPKRPLTGFKLPARFESVDVRGSVFPHLPMKRRPVRRVVFKDTSTRGYSADTTIQSQVPKWAGKDHTTLRDVLVAVKCTRTEKKVPETENLGLHPFTSIHIKMKPTLVLLTARLKTSAVLPNKRSLAVTRPMVAYVVGGTVGLFSLAAGILSEMH